MKAPYQRARFGLALAAVMLVAPNLAAADAKRLEADLRAMFGAHGTLAIGDVSSALLRSRLSAHDIRFETPEGERLLIDRYVVSGDYDRPDEVTLEGLRLEDALTDFTLMSAERIVLGEPSRAVFALDDALAAEAVRIGSLAIDGIALDLGSELADDLFYATPLYGGQGRLTVDSVRGKSLSGAAIELFEVAGVAGTLSEVDELGSASFTLESLRIEGLTGLDSDGDEQLARLELRGLDLLTDALAASLARLDMDGDFSDGKGGVQVESLFLDLARMIALAPEEERTQLRMISNVLTDGSGELRLDAAFLANWQAQGEHGVLVSDSQLSVRDALRLAFDVRLPLVLPDGVAPADLFADLEWLEAATLLGGDLRLNLADGGLFTRLATLGAAFEGVTEAQYIEQARTQAQGFGMMFGPEVRELLLGLVSLLEGSAEELELRLTLPPESQLASWLDDPLGLPARLQVSVETR